MAGPALVIFSIAGALGCSSEQFTQDLGTGGASGADGGGAGGTSGVGGAGGTSGTGGAGGDAGGCDTSKSPSEEACLVDDELAVFVSPNGKDLASGKKADPVKSIADAVALAGSTKRVIVCEGTYDEHVKLSGGTKIYGGFDCSSWAYKGSQSNVSPSTVGYALLIDAVITEVIIEDIAFTAQAGSAPGASSIAAFVKNSGDVRLRRVKLQAGPGVSGKDGVTAEFKYAPQLQLNGEAAVLTVGGKTKTCTCLAGGSTAGGAGGDAPSQGGGQGQPALGGGSGGLAGTPTNCGAGGIGKDGASPAPSDEGAGAKSVGTLTAAGWEPKSGDSGKPGTPGQGGGGGASGTTGGGGGGGCGGCGGAGGASGAGGGASIALLSLSSTVTLDDSDLVTGNAGAGGKGAPGQAGQTDVGFGGPPAAGGCQGGSGAHGGAGGPGGGGAGGVSAGIVYTGTKPSVTGGSFTLGGFGLKGVGASATNDGIDGLKAETIAIQ